MKKKNLAKILLSLGIGVCCAGSVGLAAACAPGDPSSYTVTMDYCYEGDTDVTLEVDANGKVTKPTDPTREGYVFGGWYKSTDYVEGNEWNFETDTVTDNTTIYAMWQQTFTVSFSIANSDSVIAPVTTVSGNKISKPTDPVSKTSGVSFGGWYKEATYENAWDFTTDTVTANTTLYCRWVSSVTTSVDFVAVATALGSATAQIKITEPYDYQGIISFGTGVRFEPTATRGDYVGCVNTQNVDTTVITLSGTTNSIKIVCRGASNGGFVIWKYDTDGITRVDIFGTTDAEGKLGATIPDSDLVTIEKSDMPAGTYYMECNSSVRIYEFNITQSLTLGTPTGIVADSVSAPNSELLVGSTYDKAGVTAQISYDNGTTQTKTIDAANINIDGVNTAVPGIYEATFTYTENGQTVNGKYNVYIYAINKVTLGEYTTSGNTTTNLQKIYNITSAGAATLDVDGLTVIGTGVTGTGEGVKSKEFVLSKTQYGTTTPDMTTSGEKEVTITVATAIALTSATPATANYKINVVDLNLANKVTNGTLTITVDKEAAVSATSYKTLTDAITAIELAKIPDSVMKEITISNGEYNEKVYINIPNVHLKAAESTFGTSVAAVAASEGVAAVEYQENNHKVVIWYDALNGTTDPSGTSHGTNGSASITIGSKATGFRAENITFKNYYNTNALYEESKKLTSNTQAVAVYIDAEQAAFYNCKFTSYHDTLYANNGSHYFENCVIEGRTDYIFGKNAVSYFKSCKIWSIGAGADVANGGYVVATQREADNKGVYVFDACTFDGDTNVKDGSVALGRAWSVNIKMVIMNSTISGKFSKEAHTVGGTQAQRYCTMSGNEPKAENLIEYNNTGDGAVTASIENTCTVTDAAGVAAYQLAVLFTDWVPTEKEYVTVSLISVEATEKSLGTISVYKGTVIDDTYVTALLGDYTVTGKEVSGYFASAASDATAFDYAKAPTENTSIYVQWKDLPTVETTVVATYKMTVASSAVVSSEGAPADTFTVTNEQYNATDIKFSSNNTKIIVKVALTAGQILTLKVEGKSGSSGNAAGVNHVSSLETVTSTNGELVFEADADFATHTVVYTATADGTVEITFTRSKGNTTRVKSIEATISEPVA